MNTKIKYSSIIKKVTALFFLYTYSPSVFSIEKNKNLYAQKIVVTVPFLKNITEEMFCNDKEFNILSIIPSNADPHTFSLTPENRKDIEKAHVILQVGANLDSWINKIELRNDQNLINVTKDLTLNQTNKSNTHSFDPHVWQSPQLTKQIILKLKEKYSNLFPDQSKTINQCTTDYLNKINHEVEILKKQIDRIPKKNRIIVTNHDSMSYFAQEFGFEIMSVLGVSDEELPTLAQIKSTLAKIKNKEPKALFLEYGGSPKLLDLLAKETNLKIGGKLYADSLGDPSEGAGTLLNAWKLNVQTLVNALYP